LAGTAGRADIRRPGQPQEWRGVACVGCGRVWPDVFAAGKQRPSARSAAGKRITRSAHRGTRGAQD